MGPNIFVPIRYEIEAGKKAAPESLIMFGEMKLMDYFTLLKFTRSHCCHHPDW